MLLYLLHFKSQGNYTINHTYFNITTLYITIFNFYSKPILINFKVYDMSKSFSLISSSGKSSKCLHDSEYKPNSPDRHEQPYQDSFELNIKPSVLEFALVIWLFISKSSRVHTSLVGFTLPNQSSQKDTLRKAMYSVIIYILQSVLATPRQLVQFGG